MVWYLLFILVVVVVLPGLECVVIFVCFALLFCAGWIGVAGWWLID